MHMKSIRDMVAYYNTELERDTRYEVISFLLSQLGKLDQLSMSDVARETYVSKSTVSRLVRRFGFESYDEFLDEMHGFMGQDLAVTLQVSQAQRALLVKDSSRFLDGYIDDICASLVQLKELVSQVDVDELIERSFAGETAFFATDKPLSMARDLQTAYLLAGKLVQVGETKQKRRQIASELPAGSLAIVFSNYGRYVDGNRPMLEEMRRRGVTLWLVTLCYDGPNVLLFDKIINLSRGGYTSVGGFPMRVFVEFVVRRMLLGKG